MQIMNGSPFVVDASQASDKEGNLYAVLVAKGSYGIPADDGQPLVALKPEEQEAIHVEDIYAGDVGLSDPLFENDWAFRKQRCDIILKANAHAPREATLLQAGFRVASCEKVVTVTGYRQWQKGFWGIKTGELVPFFTMPITYSRSYGGQWPEQEEDNLASICHRENPIGCGFVDKERRAQLAGEIMPNIGPANFSSDDFAKPYPPTAFGPIARNWLPRSDYAGTYDQAWQDDVFPLWPQDFDERFFQCAPEDQQIDFPTGGEPVTLWHLHPNRPKITFTLPSSLQLPTVALLNNDAPTVLEPVVDTIAIDVEAERVTLVWRAQLPLKRNLREIHSLAVGKVCKRWIKAIMTGSEDCGCGGVETEDDDMVSVTEALRT